MRNLRSKGGERLAQVEQSDLCATGAAWVVMMTLATIQREHAAIRKWQAAVAEAALPFEARWTLAALKRVDRDIHRRLVDQRDLFDQALVAGTAQDIEVHGAALPARCVCPSRA